jgi:hypothetical protein
MPGNIFARGLFCMHHNRDNRLNWDGNSKIGLISGLETHALVVESRRKHPGETQSSADRGRQIAPEGDRSGYVFRVTARKNIQ